MRKAIVYILSLAMLFSNNSMVMGAESQKESTQAAIEVMTSKEKTAKTTAATNKVEEQKEAEVKGASSEDIKVSFDEQSLTTRVGYFKDYQFKGIDMDNIQDVEFEYSSENILKMELKSDSSFEYIPVAKKAGTVKIKVIITDQDDNEYMTDEITFTVKEAEEGIVPLKSYEVYNGLEDESGDFVDANKDGQVSEEEIKKVYNIDLYYAEGLTNEDMEGLEQAVNCHIMDLGYNKDITKINFAQNMKNLSRVEISDTGIPLKEQLGLLRGFNTNILKKGQITRLKLVPDGILNFNNVKVSAENPEKLDLEVASGELYATALADQGMTNIKIQCEKETLSFPVTLEKGSEDSISVPNKNLYNALLKEGDQNKDGYLTKDEMKTIRSLGVDLQSGSQDLTALTYAENLWELDLKGSFTTIEPLTKLKNIEYLTLASDQLKSIDELKNMKTLSYLNIANCPNITDISILKRNKVGCLRVSDKIPSQQVLDFQEYKDITLKKGAYLSDSEVEVSMYDGTEEGFSPYQYSSDNQSVVTNKGKCSTTGEANVTITALGSGNKASKTIHIKVQDADSLEPSGEAIADDQLPTLSVGKDQGYTNNASVIQKNGNVYDVKSGEKVADNAKSYVANYVYCDDAYFLLKAKIGKDDGFYTSTDQNSFSKQGSSIKKYYKNYFLTNAGDLYRVNQNNKTEKIAQSIEDFMEFRGASGTDNYLILDKNGTVSQTKNKENSIDNVKEILSSDFFVLNNGTTIMMNWEKKTQVVISKQELKFVDEGNYGFMRGTTLYCYDTYSGLIKVADGVKQILPESYHVYEGLDGEYYLYEETWNDDTDQYEYESKKITCTDANFTGIGKDQVFYENGQKILSDVADFTYIGGKDGYALIRKDGTIWHYQSPYLAKKIQLKGSEDGTDSSDNTDKTEPSKPTPPVPSKPTPTKPIPTKPRTVKVSKISLSGVSKKIAAGKKIKLKAKVSPSNASNKGVTWKSSNKKVATVNSKGVVTIKKKTGGKSVTITATAKDGSKRKATYKIKVMKGVVKKVSISGKKTVKAGKTLKLKAKISASKGANRKIKWTCSNTKYATVSSSGKVKAKKAGKRKKIKITAMATDGSGKKKTITIKIK